MNNFSQLVSQLSYVWLAVWGAAAILALWLWLRKPRTLLLSKSDQGRLAISRHALNRLFETCCEQIEGVASARVRVVCRSGKYQTTLRLKTRPDARLDAIQGYLMQEIASIYRENLGLPDNIGRIDVTVVGVVPSETRFDGA